MRRIDEALEADMRAKGIDIDLSLSILDDWNAGLYDGVEAVEASSVPAVDGTRVISMKGDLHLEVAADPALALLASLRVPLPSSVGHSAGTLAFDRRSLAELGQSLYPFAGLGILTGGSATSYADRKKNLAYGGEVFAMLEEGFDRLEPLCRDRPKGLAPAWINPDGSPGASFLLIKLRARLLALRAYVGRHGQPGRPFLPLFQMSSAANDAELAAAYGRMTLDPMLSGLARELGSCDLTGASAFATGVQPMIAAFSHSAEGRPKRIFETAWGREKSSLPLPGGHGQSFRILTKVFRELRDSGIRWVWLGNVDNIGYLPDPVKLAIIALRGEPAAFEFSWRTPLDVKGGILVETRTGTRTIADIGPAISFDGVKRLEAEGASILFNCATGLFDLDWLVPRLEDIGRRLPVRFTDQDKDAGRYSQAEQVTWEVASLLPSFLSFAVEKPDRFISAKLLVETLLTSGLGAGDPRVPPELAAASALLHEGLLSKLGRDFGLELRQGAWVPRN